MSCLQVSAVDGRSLNAANCRLPVRSLARPLAHPPLSMLRVHVCMCARAAEGEKWQPGRLGVNVGARSHVTRRQLANWFPSSGPTELTGSREERRNHSLHLQPPPSPHHSVTPSLRHSSPLLRSSVHPFPPPPPLSSIPLSLLSSLLHLSSIPSFSSPPPSLHLSSPLHSFISPSFLPLPSPPHPSSLHSFITPSLVSSPPSLHLSSPHPSIPPSIHSLSLLSSIPPSLSLIPPSLIATIPPPLSHPFNVKLFIDLPQSGLLSSD